jgi:transcriptional regulator with XRE-family HTH domain
VKVSLTPAPLSHYNPKDEPQHDAQPSQITQDVERGAFEMTESEDRSEANAARAEELAHLAGVHVTYLSAIEGGERNPALENLYAVATALDVTLAELFRWSRVPCVGGAC